MGLAIFGIVVGLIGLYVGVMALKDWYRENETPAGARTATTIKMMAGFFVATIGLLGGLLPLLLS